MEYKGDIIYIKQVKAGNKNAFSFLVNRHKDNVYNLAFRISGNHEEAEDIAQDSFIKAYRALHGFKLKSRFSTWLYRIVYNTAISRVRTRKKEILSLDEFPVDATDFIGYSSTEEDAEKEYRNSLINFALQKIDAEGRSLISLYYYKEMNIRDISDITGISISKAKVKLLRTRQKMLEIIEKVEKKKLVNYE